MNNGIWLKGLIILTTFLCNISSVAETYNVGLLTNRIHQRIAQLNDNITFMNDRNKDLSTRNQIMRKCLTSFINDSVNSNDYCTLFIEYSIAGKKKKFRRTVANYFQGLVNLRYKPVTIISVNLLSSNNIYFDRNTSVVAPETIDLELLDNRNNNLISVPCTVFHEDKGTYEHTDLYLQIIETIDGVELIPQITTLHAIM